VKAARAGFPATGIDEKTALIELSCLGALQNPQIIYIYIAFDQPLCLVERARGLLFQRHRRS
jgi:hypothetical protein